MLSVFVFNGLNVTGILIEVFVLILLETLVTCAIIISVVASISPFLDFWSLSLAVQHLVWSLMLLLNRFCQPGVACIFVCQLFFVIDWLDVL